MLNVSHEKKHTRRITAVANLNSKNREQNVESKRRIKRFTLNNRESTVNSSNQPQIIPIPKIIKLEHDESKNSILHSDFNLPEKIKFDGVKFVLEDDTLTEVPSRVIAEYILRDSAQKRDRKAKSQRNVQYHRHIPNVDNGYRLYGKKNFFSYSPVLDDFTFLVDFSKRCAQYNTDRVFSFKFLTSLLTQSLDSYNFVECNNSESMSFLNCDTLDEFLRVFQKPVKIPAKENFDNAIITALVQSLANLDLNIDLPIHKLNSDFEHKSNNLVTHEIFKEQTSCMVDQVNFDELFDENFYDKQQNETRKLKFSFANLSVAKLATPGNAISELPSYALAMYRKLYRSWLTDETFLYLIHLFEVLTNTKELVPISSAVEEAQFILGEICPSTKTIQAVYQHWKYRRDITKYPLLRQYWMVPSSNDTNPFAVFRARTREKMVLRRQRKTPFDVRYNEIMKSFTYSQKLLLAVRLRDWLKLAICDLDCIMYEQLWKEMTDPTYQHPVWPCLERNVLPKITQLIKFHSNTTAATWPISKNPNVCNFNPPYMGFHDRKRQRDATSVLFRKAPSNNLFYMGLTKIDKATDQEDDIDELVFVSPVPLPPIFFELNPKTTTIDLFKKSLEEAYVTSFKPVALFCPFQKQVGAQNYQSSNVNTVNENPNITSRVNNNLLKKTVSSRQSSIESFINPLSNIPLGYLPVYIQNIEKLPKSIQHVCNCRFVIPFGSCETMLGSSNLEKNDEQKSSEPANSRCYFHLGRSNRLWFHKIPFLHPSTNLFAQIEKKFKDEGIMGLLDEEKDPSSIPILVNINNMLLPIATTSSPTGKMEESGYYYDNNPVECSLTEDSSFDVEPGFTLPFGFDSYENSGGAAAFSLPRYASQRAIELDYWVSQIEKQKPP